MHMLITGGSRGIGAATARLAAQAGYRVSINYQQNRQAAESVAAAIAGAGGEAVCLPGDMGVPADIEALFEAACDRFGPLDAFVNNAGIIGRACRLDEASPETIAQVVQVNVTGMMLAAREAVRRMSTRHGGAGGSIVNLSSAAATLGGPGDFVWYAASKGAVDSFTIGLAKEVAAEGLRVNAVAPGLIATDIHAAAGKPERLEQLGGATPIGRYGTAEEVAQVIIWLCSPGASYITGETVRVAGGR